MRIRAGLANINLLIGQALLLSQSVFLGVLILKLGTCFIVLFRRDYFLHFFFFVTYSRHILEKSENGFGDN